MIRIIIFFAFVVILAVGSVWIVERPGFVSFNWLGYDIKISVLFFLLLLLLLSVIIYYSTIFFRGIMVSPHNILGFLKDHRKKKGYSALSQGMIALSVGDLETANKLSNTAESILSDEPLAQLLKAQTAQARGRANSAKLIYRSMVNSPNTEILGLHGLFINAMTEKDFETSRLLVEKAVSKIPSTEWALKALLKFQARDNDWENALSTLLKQANNKLIEKAETNRKQAVIKTAMAIDVEDSEPLKAISHALEAHKLAPELVPAAVILGRLYSEQGKYSKASSVLEKTWKLSPHPDIAEVYANVRMGESPTDRLKRVRFLSTKNPDAIEGVVAISKAARAARQWEEAKNVLTTRIDEATKNICMLIAEIEEEGFKNHGKAREWLAKAIHAPDDKIWTADGIVSESWIPYSPITGKLDVFEWKAPVSGQTPVDFSLENARIDKEAITLVNPEDVIFDKDVDDDMLDDENMIDITKNVDDNIIIDAKGENDKKDNGESNNDTKDVEELIETKEVEKATSKNDDKSDNIIDGEKEVDMKSAKPELDEVLDDDKISMAKADKKNTKATKSKLKQKILNNNLAFAPDDPGVRVAHKKKK